MTQPQMDESRKAFEKWAITPDGWFKPHDLALLDEGFYARPETEGAWQGWQAAIKYMEGKDG